MLNHKIALSYPPLESDAIYINDVNREFKLEISEIFIFNKNEFLL